MFAFGISTFADRDNSTDQSLDYGTLVAQYEQWNLTSRTFEPIATRPCTLADFGLGDEKQPDQAFFDANPIQKDLFDLKLNALNCLA